jgi:hypothetical protein
MWYSFMMYVRDNSVTKVKDEGVPKLDIWTVENLKYPCIVFGYTTVEELSTVISDRRGVYNKFKSHSRYYKEYMEVYRYVDNSEKPENLTIEILLLGENNDKNVMMESLYSTIIKYRLFYGDLVYAKEYIHIMSKMKLNIGLEKEIIVQKVLTPGEKRKISRKRYEDSVRDKLREKSKAYYALHKEELAEKRRQKNAVQGAAGVPGVQGAAGAPGAEP